MTVMPNNLAALRKWIAAECTTEQGDWCPFGDLFDAWIVYALKHSHFRLRQKDIALAFGTLGYERARVSGRRCYIGIRLVDPPAEPDANGRRDR